MRAFSLLVIGLLAAPVGAQSLSRVTVGVTGGTLGVGPEVSYQVNPFIGLRASATWLSIGASGTTGGYHYSGTGHISNWGGTVDFYPFSHGISGFRLSAGGRDVEHNRVQFTGQANLTRVYNGVSYTPDQAGTISGTVRARSVAPVATMGFAKRAAGFMFGIDGGVMFHGRPVAYDFVPTGQLATNPNAQGEFQNQQARIENDIHGYRYYPVLQASIGYRF